MIVFSDGNVRPACECTINVGNVLTDSIEDIWNGQTMQTYRRKIRALDAAGWCSNTCMTGVVNPEYRESIEL